ncbi:sensor histidine kinase [Williamsia phyllosphaerae]|uniref:histidine kinase n=1 Tax=Williamsia phyllosphaerae TaxID=885042 RepID=A0ABQ1UB27_9NOCA|nr:HAMP domain-containing sensor histidine kinase [Williamsia phyllosphaerae]GGF13575.1 two-component sensor histidine kinase [Williamsia phyllosphaerae]
MDNDIGSIVVTALLWSAPVMVAGTAVLILVRRRSLVVSNVILVLTPLVALLSGLIGVSGFMFTNDLKRTVTVLATVFLVAIPASIALARFQARRTVWERQVWDQERAAEHSRRELIAWISHDLRTPLADIRAVAEALTDSVVTDTTEVTRFAQLIDQDAIRLSAMVDDLFEMSKINSGALRLDREAVDLREVVDEVAAASTPTAARAGVEFELSVPPAVVPVFADTRALARVLTNLVINAIAHTPDGGTVTIGIEVVDEVAVVRVDDTGPGIADHDMARIFDVAYRGTAARTPPSERGLPAGSGMGLAIAEGLVLAHQGRISVSNRHPGSRFEVTLPLYRG